MPISGDNHKTAIYEVRRWDKRDNISRLMSSSRLGPLQEERLHRDGQAGAGYLAVGTLAYRIIRERIKEAAKPTHDLRRDAIGRRLAELFRAAWAGNVSLIGDEIERAARVTDWLPPTVGRQGICLSFRVPAGNESAVLCLSWLFGEQARRVRACRRCGFPVRPSTGSQGTLCDDCLEMRELRGNDELAKRLDLLRRRLRRRVSRNRLSREDYETSLEDASRGIRLVMKGKMRLQVWVQRHDTHERRGPKPPRPRIEAQAARRTHRRTRTQTRGRAPRPPGGRRDGRTETSRPA